MSLDFATLFPTAEPARQKLIGWWQARSPRERIVLAVMGGLIALWVLISLIILPIQRARAESRLVITSATFGMVGAADPIPPYRFSSGSRLPELGTPESFWRSRLDGLFTDPDELVLDLRSGAYAAFARIPQALPSRVLTEAADGSRSIVSHFSKHAKGVLARALSTSRAELADRAAVLRVARTAGLRVEPWGRTGIQVIT